MKKKKLIAIIKEFEKEIEKMDDDASKEYTLLYEENEYLRMKINMINSQLRAARHIIKRNEENENAEFSIIKTNNDFMVVK